MLLRIFLYRETNVCKQVLREDMVQVRDMPGLSGFLEPLEKNTVENVNGRDERLQEKSSGKGTRGRPEIWGIQIRHQDKERSGIS